MDRSITLIDAFKSTIDKYNCGITFINGEKEEHYTSYKDLFDRALCILYNLQVKGIRQGDEVIFQIENTEDFISIFWACILGGIVPVPVAVGNNDENKLKVFKVWEKLNRPHLITTPSILSNLKTFVEKSGKNLQINKVVENTIYVSDLGESDAKAEIAGIDPDDIAFIQFSSGSTGSPKGVILTHDNLIANIYAIIKATRFTKMDSTLSWMPLTHDMGLIGFHLVPLVNSINQYIMPTSLFIRHPRLWIRKSSDHKVTTIASPNFGYQYFLRFIDNKPDADWDLSNIRLILNGAEPISADLCHRFMEALGKYGLKKSAMYTVYGLAEACLGASFPQAGEEFVSINVKRDSVKIGEKVKIVSERDNNTLTLVDLGQPIDFMSIRICDENDSVLDDCVVGHIQIKGRNVTKGYYNDKEVTEKSFSKDGWLKTGDLGFKLNGHIVITGRAKDIIFVNGQNFYPHDIERVTEAVGDISLGEVAAGSIFDYEKGRDIILLFVIYKKAVESFVPLLSEIKKHIRKSLGLEIDEVIPIKKMPKTTSGKIQRYKLLEKYENKEFDSILEELRKYSTDSSSAELDETREDRVEKTLLDICREVMGISSIGAEDNLIEYGGNSILLNLIHSKIDTVYPGKTQISDLFTYPTVKKLASFIKAGGIGSTKIRDNAVCYGKTTYENNDIAIIGMAVRLPNADDLNEFWEGIRSGVCYVADFPEIRRNDIDRYLDYKNGKAIDYRYLKGAYLGEIDKFDNSYFKISPNEASLMNPTHRMFIETVFSAVEDAGYGGNKLAGKNVGVYVGQISDLEGYKYKEMIHEVDPGLLPVSAAGNISTLIPNRISYTLDLKGPSMIVDTACSSSLVALHAACQAIRFGECESAIVGSSKISFIPLDKDCYKIGIESSDYLTRTFDKNADGSGMGEGIAAVMVKPIQKALADGDNIYAVIKSSAVNQDGTSMGITAPNAESQSEVVLKSWRLAGINPETLSYIEGHGTGTRIGDVIEIDGLQRAFSQSTAMKQFCAIGSVKSNLGHLYDSAGLIGLIKAVLSLKHKEIPPSIGFNSPNNKIDFSSTALYVNAKLKTWKVGEHPRRCGVSSFGIGGTNCHVVLEEAPVLNTDYDDVMEYKLIAISAKSEDSLSKLVHEYYRFICKEALNQNKLNDMCYTANTGRGHHKKRLAIVFRDYTDLKEKISIVEGSGFERIDVDGIYFGEVKMPMGRIAEENSNTYEMRKESLNKEACDSVYRFVGSGYKDVTALEEVCLSYINGADIEWEKIYSKGSYRRISIPTYQFERKRHWLKIPEVKTENEAVYLGDVFHAMKWKQNPLDVQFIGDKGISGPLLVMKDNVGLGDSIISKLASNGGEIIEVNWGEESGQNANTGCVVSDKEHEYEALAQMIISKGVTRILHLFSYASVDENEDENILNMTQDKGVFSLFHLAKALTRNNLKDSIEVILISDFVNGVSGEESRLRPENATLFGLGKVVGLESSKLKCRCIDIDNGTSVDSIISEINSSTYVPLVAYRNGIRYVEEFTEVEDMPIEKSEVELKSEGIYVITGGLGGIGIEIAKMMASKKPVNLALINRSKFPEPSEWDNILSDDTDKDLCRKISCLREIQSTGTGVMLLSLDISKCEEVEKALEDLRNKYGRINGIIHGAGVAGSGLLMNKEINEFRNVLYPKVWGTWALHKATEKDELDFFVMFSSALTLAGDIGQSDYVAANSYQDSFAAYRNLKNNKTITINWVDWGEVGMAHRFGFKSNGIFKPLMTKTGVAAFETVLASGTPRVIIGEIEADAVNLKLLEKASVCISDNVRSKMLLGGETKTAVSKEVSSDYSSKVRMTGREDGEYSKTEKEVAGLCNLVLGFEEVNIYDSFFEMGADSILLKRIYTYLDEKYPGKLSITDLFAYTSVYKLSAYLDGENESIVKVETSDKKLEMDKLFDDIENGSLSIDEALESIRRM